LYSYLPHIDATKLWQIIGAKSWRDLVAYIESIDKSTYERLGFDRLLTIVLDCIKRFGFCEGLKILDVGCNTGLFSISMAALGNKVTGLDNFVIDVQELYDQIRFPFINKISARLNLVKQDILEFCDVDTNVWDIILLLSVAHHWESGYAKSQTNKYTEAQISKVFNKLFTSFRKAIYYECPLEEPGFPFGYGYHMLQKYVNNFASYKLYEIEITIGPNGYLRQLLRIER